ncbi:2-C-methyl-D-erythritol 4-phosphate cytidylyltransferase [Rhodobacterales bacterium 56_14_T64]|nr:2-C-methyl-D-erythritol 4-phosphate cytidylyltransferase [Rhodobacterales bacterium 56_14_T64]
MTLAALIVAAGRGIRAGGELPKQWQMLNGMRVADWTLRTFMNSQMDHIVLVLPPNDVEVWEIYSAMPGLILAAGGQDRATSVLNGLQALKNYNVSKVLIHDVARPCISPTLIQHVVAALDHGPAAAPAVAVTDALWTGIDGRVTGTRNRNGLFAAQTPQGFHYDAILAAHLAHRGGAADDVEVARSAGLDVTIVPGDPDNIKITTPGDFARAERILGT